MNVLPRAALAAFSLAALAALPQVASAASSQPAALGRAAPTKVTICHATGSTTNPYVTITVSQAGLNGHSGHGDDLIPAPEDGCPSSLDQDHDDDAAGSDDATGDGASTDDSSGDASTEDELDLGDRVTICHATRSARRPYRTITVSRAALAGHEAHAEDIVPAPVDGCPTAPRGVATGNRCRSARHALAFASGPHAVTLRSCRGTYLRMWGDPWVTWQERGMRRPMTFPVGYGDWSVDLPGGVRVRWTTDALARNAMSSMTIESMAGSTTILPTHYQSDDPRSRSAQVVLSTQQLRALRNALLRCAGDPQEPISCNGSGVPAATQQHPDRPRPPRPPQDQGDQAAPPKPLGPPPPPPAEPV